MCVCVCVRMVRSENGIKTIGSQAERRRRVLRARMVHAHTDTRSSRRQLHVPIVAVVVAATV